MLTGDAALWADRAADAAEAAAAMALAIRLSPPDGEGLPLRAAVRSGPGSPLGPPEERLLRRAAQVWPPLAGLCRTGTVTGDEAAGLLGPAGDRLAAIGITVEWPADVVAASGLTAGVLVSLVGSGTAATGSLSGPAHLTWQLSLDGEPLTAAETEAAAHAVAGVLRLRGRWVVVDAATRQRARDRHAGQLTGVAALSAALTGEVPDAAGGALRCTAAGHLADLVASLRAGAISPGTSATPEPITGLTATLREYQRAGVQWLLRTTSLGFGALLADDMGLGKTLTVIAFRLVRSARTGPGRTGPSLVVCPASLLATWEREFARFAPGLTVRRHHGAGRTLAAPGGQDVVITTYGTLVRDADMLAAVPWDLVVADEAQAVKNHRAQAAKALRTLRPAVRVAVTGTPVENSLSELWSILDWTNPGLFGPLSVFRERFGRPAEQAGSGSADAAGAADRLRRLISPFVLRRRKTDPAILPELPAKVTSDRFARLTREQAALYDAVTAEAMDRIGASAGVERRGQVLRLLQSLRQICNSPAQFLREPAEGWDPAAQAARSGKLHVLDELMESIVLADDAALIFTGYVSMGRLLQAHLAARGIRAGFLHGGVPVTARQGVADRFQDGEGEALILSVRAAGTGLTLTRAGHVIHFDRPWNPAVEDQATDRAHRMGQHRLVEVHHLITEGTVEDRMAELLARKRGLTEAVLATGEAALTELTDAELSALVRLSATDATYPAPPLSTGGQA